MKNNGKNWICNSLEEIESRIQSPELEVISFDVFDTLLVRPVERETDLFELLDQKFGEQSSAQISFRKLRVEAEAILRRRIISGECLREDVTLEEIYKVLEQSFGLERELTKSMLQFELQLEERLCAPRKSGLRLYHKALETGKRMIAVSDMYLNTKQVRSLLKKNGFSEFHALFVSSDMGVRKTTGNLYAAVAQTLGVSPDKILHIGDNEDSDCRQAAEQGFLTAWLPRTLSVYDRYGCGHQVEGFCREQTDWEAAKQSVGIGIQRTLAANYYFDDPFRAFDKTSDYNADPYFVGYGALGMELLGLVRWLSDQLKRDQIRHMIFLARDGYLPMKLYERYRQEHPELPVAGYLPVSRLAVLPAMIQSKEDLYDLPVDVTFQTPRKLLKLLDFCTAQNPDGGAAKGNGNILGLPSDQAFTRPTFLTFIERFLANCYDRERHEEAIRHLREFFQKNSYAPVTEDSALFDMGYSGRIAAAIAQSAGVRPAVYYFHTDAREHYRYEKRSGIQIRSFLDFNPYMESSLREYSYLEPEASCIGYTKELTPIYDIGPAKGYREAAEAMQKGAMAFAEDYLQTFSGFEKETGFRCHDAAMPFEAFLRNCSPADRSIYERVLIDDELWGGRRDIDLRKLMEARLGKLPDYAKGMRRNE